MSKKIMILGAGGGGGNNLIRSIRKSCIETKIIGSNCLPHAVVKSTADTTYLLPESSSDHYLESLIDVIKKENVDLVIPNNDREVSAVSFVRDKLPCRTFLPPKETVKVCQDKHLLFEFMNKQGLDTIPSVNISSVKEIDDAFKVLPKSCKYWLRPRRGSGSKGATWVQNSGQARKWITLWSELQGIAPDSFQLSCFMPGKDYNFHSIWNDGELIVASIAERISYFMGSLRLSGMSSTPEIARTTVDKVTTNMLLKLIPKLPGGVPNGNYNVDLKGDEDGNMYLTEINIGRFPMITTIHDSVGRINTAEAYVRCGLGERYDFGDPIDQTEGYLLIRELDTEPLVLHENQLPALNK